MKLGVCYYPEHWPEDWWADDARRMREMGLSTVRIGEFAWSRIEPERCRFDWGWLDRAIGVLHGEGLEVVLGTPTATPPKWLVARHPDILPCDEQVRPRRFGSRRHYDFSSAAYRREAARIVDALAERYGAHPAIVAWQTDNEYGCHDTVESFSPAAAAAFRVWLAAKYRDVAALNAAWGTVFWSQDYRSFDEVDPPNATVTEANPSHRLDWQRFASDEVVAFNRMQADIIRAHAPGRDVMHNFMGMFTAFDHHAVARDLDVAGWDSYPLGFLDQGWDDAATKARYLRQGHPDFAAFHHDLYRGAGRGRMWVVEQQPGPVNWAPWNPAPLPGMVRLWTWEAFAHGAELVSYFRWRQAPFAQEQMHAGLTRPDRADAVAANEVRQVAAEMRGIAGATRRADVALLFDYAGLWAQQIQPQGRDFDPLRLAFEWYTAARELGLDIDILPPSADLSGYRLIVAPSLPMLDAATVTRLGDSGAELLFGPRSGSKTADLQIPSELPPGPLQALMPVKVTRVESLRPGVVEPCEAGRLLRWREEIERAPPGRVVHGSGRARYVSAWLDAESLRGVVRAAAERAGLSPADLPEGLRLRRLGGVRFAFNYAPEAVTMPIAAGAYLLGSAVLEPAGVAAWTDAP